MKPRRNAIGGVLLCLAIWFVGGLIVALIYGLATRLL